MVTHPTGSDHGCSYKEHEVCGSVIIADIVVHLWKVQCYIFLDESDHHLFVQLVGFPTGWIIAVLSSANDAGADKAVESMATLDDPLHIV